MVDFLEMIGRGSVQALWMPVLVWTGLAGAGALLLELGRGLHPLSGYRVRQGLLFALPASVLAAPWVPALWRPAGDLLRPVLPAALEPVVPATSGGIPVVPGPGNAVDIAAALLGTATAVIVLLALARLAILAIDLNRLHRLRLATPRVDDSIPRRMLGELAEQLGMRRPVELLEGPPESAPMTFGAWRPAVVVPRAVLDSPDSLRTVFAHELIHVRRADYLWALLDSFTLVAFAFHPLVWLLRRGIERCRETSCDAEVVAKGIVRPREYAEVLAHTHTPTQFPTPAVAASMSASSVTLKERLETMQDFADTRLTFRWRIGLAAGTGILFLLIATIGACAGKTPRDAPAQPAQGDSSAEGVDKATKHYLIPLGIDPEGPVQYTRMTEAEVQEELARLEIQIRYLREQMEELERADATRPATYDERSRGQVLQSMLTEVVKRSETVKLLYETENRLRDRP